MSKVAVCCCLKWRGSEWVSRWKRGCRKITENWLFCQHFIRRFTESWPCPPPPPHPLLHKAKEIEWVWIDWQTNLFFISFLLSLPLSRSDIQYDLFLMILRGWNYISSTHIVKVGPGHTKGITGTCINVLILQWKACFIIPYIQSIQYIRSNYHVRPRKDRKDKIYSRFHTGLF